MSGYPRKKHHYIPNPIIGLENDYACRHAKPTLALVGILEATRNYN